VSTSYSIEDTDDIIELDFNQRTGYRFGVLSKPYDKGDDGYEAMILDHEGDVGWRSIASGPSEARRKVIAKALADWPEIQAQLDLAKKLEAQAMTELSDSAED
jgi:hypothetical protein